MIDTITQRRVCIEDYLIDVSTQCVEIVRTLLDRNNVSYWMDSSSISVDDGPEMICVFISRNNPNIPWIQNLLDNYELPQVTVQGKQIASGRKQIIDRAMEAFLSCSKDRGINWGLYDLLITVTPKKEYADV